MHPKYIATAIAVALGAAVAIPAAVSADQHMAGATMEQRGDALSTSGLQAERRNDMDVPNNAGKEIGEVEKVSRHNGDNELYSIVLAGGFLDISDRYIALPLGQTEFRADKLVANDVGPEDKLESRSECREHVYTEPGDDELVNIARSCGRQAHVASDAASSPHDSGLGFGSLDVNRDGNLNKGAMGRGKQFADREKEHGLLRHTLGEERGLWTGTRLVRFRVIELPASDWRDEVWV